MILKCVYLMKQRNFFIFVPAIEYNILLIYMRKTLVKKKIILNVF